MNALVLLFAFGLAAGGWDHAGFFGALTGFVTVIVMGSGFAIATGDASTGVDSANSRVGMAQRVGGAIAVLAAPAGAAWLGWTWGSLGAVGGYIAGMLSSPLLGLVLGTDDREKAEEQSIALAFVGKLEAETNHTWRELLGEVLERPNDVDKRSFWRCDVGRRFYAASAAVRLAQLDGVFEPDQASRLREYVTEYFERQDENREQPVDPPTAELVTSYEGLLKDASEKSVPRMAPSEFESAVDSVASVLADRFNGRDRLAVDRQVLTSYLKSFLCKEDSFTFWSDVSRQFQLVPNS